MAQFPLLWIDQCNFPSFRKIKGLGFDPDYARWWEDYKRVVIELHEERHTILPIEFDGEEFGIAPDQDALRRYTRLRAMEFAG